MKKMVLAGAVLIAALAACGGGSSGGALPTTIATPQVTSAPAASFKMPQAVGPIPTLGYQPVIVPANGQLLDHGVAFTLAGPVNVYNIGTTDTVSFTFGPNTAGFPVAALVGTTTTGVDALFSTTGAFVHSVQINGKTAISCGMDGYNFNEGAFPSQPLDNTGIQNVDYFVCAGNPFI